MIEAHAQIDLDAPVEVVFDYLADATNEPDWLPGATEVTKIGDGPVGRGTCFEGTYARAGRVSLEIVTFERPQRLTFRARSRIVDFTDAIELSEQKGTTRLTATMVAQPRGVMRLMAPLMARTMRSQFEANRSHLAGAVGG